MDEGAIDVMLAAYLKSMSMTHPTSFQRDAMKAIYTDLANYLGSGGLRDERIARLTERILDLEDEGDVARKRIAALEREIRILEARGE